jgi:hypothetical protein
MFTGFSVLAVLCLQNQPMAKSGFFDIETGQPANLSMATLDLALEAAADFSPELSRTATSSRKVRLVNPGRSDFEVNIDANSFESLLVCSKIGIRAYLDDVEVFVGDLLDFAVFGLKLGAGDSRDLLIEANL